MKTLMTIDGMAQQAYGLDDEVFDEMLAARKRVLRKIERDINDELDAAVANARDDLEHLIASLTSDLDDIENYDGDDRLEYLSEFCETSRYRISTGSVDLEEIERRQGELSLETEDHQRRMYNVDWVFTNNNEGLDWLFDWFERNGIEISDDVEA